jgi:N-acetylglucosamine kinase-like BadF-type ATPase
VKIGCGMMYIVGVDGGGTKTSAIVFDTEGKFYGKKTKEFPSSIDSVSIEQVHHQIEELIIDIIAKKKDNIILTSIFLGLGGIASSTDSTHVESLVKSWQICDSTTMIQVKNDIYNAHASGLMGKPGICFIIGTGSVGFGVDEEANEHRVGGYSYKEGDPGSSFHLGRMTLKQLAKAMDHRITLTPFLMEVQTHLKIKSYSDYVGVINSISRYETAQLAKMVIKYTDRGDPIALKLINIATDEIILMLQAIINILHIRNRKIAIIGSLGNSESVFKNTLYEKVKKIDANYEIFPTTRDPVLGSGILAFKQIGNNNYEEYLNSVY